VERADRKAREAALRQVPQNGRVCRAIAREYGERIGGGRTGNGFVALESMGEVDAGWREVRVAKPRCGSGELKFIDLRRAKTMKVVTHLSFKSRDQATSPAWLFEADVFGATADPIKAEIRRRGMGCEITRQDLLARGLAAQHLGDCVIACGSFPFVRHVQTH